MFEHAASASSARWGRRQRIHCKLSTCSRPFAPDVFVLDMRSYRGNSVNLQAAHKFFSPPISPSQVRRLQWLAARELRVFCVQCERWMTLIGFAPDTRIAQGCDRHRQLQQVDGAAPRPRSWENTCCVSSRPEMR